MSPAARLFKRSFLMHGLKRSGNHAVIDWLNEDKKIFVLNNVLPVKYDLADRTEMQTGTLPASRMSWRRLLSHRFIRREPYILMTIEDQSLVKLAIGERESADRNLLIIREPINLFSSRIRKASNVEMIAYPPARNWIFDRAVELWKEHCREALGATQHLRAKVVIYFDRWLIDSSYRAELLRELELPRAPSVAMAVNTSPVGGGSSFGDTVPNGERLTNRKDLLNADELKLLSAVRGDAELMQLRDDLIKRHGGR